MSNNPIRALKGAQHLADEQGLRIALRRSQQALAMSPSLPDFHAGYQPSLGGFQSKHSFEFERPALAPGAHGAGFSRANFQRTLEPAAEPSGPGRPVRSLQASEAVGPTPEEISGAPPWCSMHAQEDPAAFLRRRKGAELRSKQSLLGGGRLTGCDSSESLGGGGAFHAAPSAAPSVSPDARAPLRSTQLWQPQPSAPSPQRPAVACSNSPAAHRSPGAGSNHPHLPELQHERLRFLRREMAALDSELQVLIERRAQLAREIARLEPAPGQDIGQAGHRASPSRPPDARGNPLWSMYHSRRP